MSDDDSARRFTPTNIHEEEPEVLRVGDMVVEERAS